MSNEKRAFGCLGDLLGMKSWPVIATYAYVDIIIIICRNYAMYFFEVMYLHI